MSQVCIKAAVILVAKLVKWEVQITIEGLFAGYCFLLLR